MNGLSIYPSPCDAEIIVSTWLQNTFSLLMAVVGDRCNKVSHTLQTAQKWRPTGVHGIMLQMQAVGGL